MMCSLSKKACCGDKDVARQIMSDLGPLKTNDSNVAYSLFVGFWGFDAFSVVDPGLV